MSFRRSSSLSREDGLTLEQRLVMQLTAAMRHDDSMHAVEEHPADATPTAGPSHAPAPHAPHAGQHLDPHTPAVPGLHTLQPGHAPQLGHGPQPGHAPDLHSMDASELSTMLRTLGASLESLGSAIGGSSDAPAAGGTHEPVPHAGALSGHGELPGHAGHAHAGHAPVGHAPVGHAPVGHSPAGHAPAGGAHAADQSLLNSLGALEGLGNLSQLGGLGGLLSSIGLHEQPNADLGASLESLGHLDLGNLASLGTQQSAPASANAQAQHAAQPAAQLAATRAATQAAAQTATHDAQRDAQRNMFHDANHIAHHDLHGDAHGDAHRDAHHGVAMLGSAAPHLDTARHAATAAADTQRTTPSPEPSATEHPTLGLSQVEIDPDVSSIQSVLQSLLTAGSAGSSSGFASEAAAPTASEEVANTAAAPAAHAESSAAADQNKGFEMPSLANFGLETEDQMLVDSLRSAIENQLSGATAEPDASAAEDSSTDALRPSRATGRVSKARTQSRTKKSRAESIMHADDFESSSFRDQSSDFGASDPDTLRAIQQALLSALGPSASTTSLTESLTESITSELKASAAADTGPSDADAATESRQASAAAGPELATQPASAQSASAKAAERIMRVPAKKVATKVAKPTERDRQKLREENAARKRRWREENVLQNRDNDLRARIIRRAQTMFGEGESAQKAQWIEAEYQRRRQKRILRADINSLVANAMETARSRAASEQAGSQRVSGQRLTLTQQTRQIASSQLSELFRRSNAVLEPQLHSEKLSVPLAPYLLVPSPNRPPYKVEWKSQPASTASDAAPAESPAEKNGHTAPASVPAPNEPSKGPVREQNETNEGAVAEPNDAAKAASPVAAADGAVEAASLQAPTTEGVSPKESASSEAAPIQAGEAGGATSPKTAPTETGSEAASRAASPKAASPKAAAEAASPPKSAAPSKPASPPKPASPGPASKEGAPSDKASSPSTKSGTGSDSGAAAGERALFSMRPKHRYGLVGNAQLGVPPNLAAIYQKLTLRNSATEQA